MGEKSLLSNVFSVLSNASHTSGFSGFPSYSFAINLALTRDEFSTESCVFVLPQTRSIKVLLLSS